MSFTSKSIKPKLVESKIVDKIMKVQEVNKPFKFKIWDLILKFMKENLFILIFTVFFIILLIYRYYDVKSRKEKRKKIENNSDEETSSSASD